MSTALMFKMEHQHDAEDRCSRGWLVSEPIVRDSLGRHNPSLGDGSPKNWLLLRCNSTNCHGQAVLRIDKAVEFIWQQNKSADDPCEYIHLAYIPAQKLNDMERRFRR